MGTRELGTPVRKGSVVRRLLMLVLAVLMASGLCLAQGMGNGNGKGGNKAGGAGGPITGPFRSPNNVMKMHSLTTAQRRAAAARNDDRVKKNQKNKPHAAGEVKS